MKKYILALSVLPTLAALSADVEVSFLTPSIVRIVRAPQGKVEKKVDVIVAKPEAVAREKGELNVFASSYVGDHVRLDNPLSCVRWEAGTKGAATANAECRQLLTLDAAPSATVRLGVNGQKKGGY